MVSAEGGKEWAAELEEHLGQLQRPSREDLFVLLLTWLRRHDTAVQDELRRLDQLLALVEPLRTAAPASLVTALISAESTGQLALTAIGATRALDRDLAERSPRLLTGEHLGVDGRRYRVRRRITLESVDPLYGAAKDNPVFAVARRMACIPVDPAGDVVVADAARLPEATRTRLASVNESRSLRVFIDALASDPVQWSAEGPWTAVHRRHDVELENELRAALDDAAAQEADILLLPELALCPESLEHLRRDLRRRRGRHPVLLAVGLTHQPSGHGPLVVNEAVLLNGRGRELLRHRKLNAYPGVQGKRAERLLAGDTIQVLATPVGNLSMLICRDLFDGMRAEQTLQLGHITWLLVPSLSPSTSPHLTRASALRPRWITTVVCNTWRPGELRGQHVVAGPTVPPVSLPERRRLFEIIL